MLGSGKAGVAVRRDAGLSVHSRHSEAVSNVGRRWYRVRWPCGRRAQIHENDGGIDRRHRVCERPKVAGAKYLRSIGERMQRAPLCGRAERCDQTSFLFTAARGHHGFVCKSAAALKASAKYEMPDFGSSTRQNGEVWRRSRERVRWGASGPFHRAAIAGILLVRRHRDGRHLAPLSTVSDRRGFSDNPQAHRTTPMTPAFGIKSRASDTVDAAEKQLINPYRRKPSLSSDIAAIRQGTANHLAR